MIRICSRTRTFLLERGEIPILLHIGLDERDGQGYAVDVNCVKKMDRENIEELKGFVEHCKQNPSLLHTPPLAFFKTFLLRYFFVCNFLVIRLCKHGLVLDYVV